MPPSIYTFTKEKLLTHGVYNTSDGQLIMSDRVLFLKFVGLERVFRASDFFAVQDAVDEIRTYTSKIGKPHLLVFAYMYLSFSEATPCYTHLPETTDTEKVRRTFDYIRAITSEKRLIGDWARVCYDRYSPSFFKALHRDKK